MRILKPLSLAFARSERTFAAGGLMRAEAATDRLRRFAFGQLALTYHKL